MAARAASVREEVAALQASIDSAKSQFEAFKTQAEALGARLRAFRLPDILPNLPLNIAFPRIDRRVPDMTWRTSRISPELRLRGITESAWRIPLPGYMQRRDDKFSNFL